MDESTKQRKAHLRLIAIKKTVPSPVADNIKRIESVLLSARDNDARQVLKNLLAKANRDLMEENMLNGEKMLSYYESMIIKLQDRVDELQKEAMFLTRRVSKYAKKCRIIDEDRTHFRLEVQKLTKGATC